MHFFGHLKTVMRHRRTVIGHAAKCGILWQGLRHDLSKYNPIEFLEGIKYYQGNRSPNEAERAEKGYSEAWMHHKGRNRHHFEYWTDYNPKTRSIMPIKMPIKYVKEMFCDRVAATKVYLDGDYHDSAALDYFLRGRAKFNMHPETAQLLEKLLTMLRDEGEEKTFRYIKSLTDY
ncbi:MAG: catalase [Clostridia bacterium]|nr:catalase [Clostridia bacterium]